MSSVDHGPLDAGAEPPRPVCRTCGATATDDATTLTWGMSIEDGRTVWTCPSCARRHLRSIEGKLDSDWW